eukprot:TRINITY_DN65576_c0_g1_i1.p1 TRINITY_DN65576_c0_g1~~TRINITY_DN65576_c0_g1_i1.p1  ORF type:complete len:1198 (+),score=310.14 TRINITY_DN65576_c0_g1_i1:69-3596(+)
MSKEQAAYFHELKASATKLKKLLAPLAEASDFSDSGSEPDSKAPEAGSRDKSKTQQTEQLGAKTPAPTQRRRVQYDTAEEEEGSGDEQQDGAHEQFGDAGPDGEEDELLVFALEDLLDSDSSDFNLEVSRAHIDACFSKFRVNARVESAHEMSQWMEFVHKLHDRSKVFLENAELSQKKAGMGLQERSDKIASMINSSSVKTIRAMREFLEKVGIHRTETLQALKAKHSQAVFDKFWESMNESREKQKEADKERRRQNVLFEDEPNSPRSPTSPKSKGSDHDIITLSTVSSSLLEVISKQQDEITFLRALMEVETNKAKQLEHVLKYAQSQQKDEAGDLPEGGVEMLQQLRSKLRESAMDNIMSTEKGRTMVQRAAGEDVDKEGQHRLQQESEQLKKKAQELEEQLTNTLSLPERVDGLQKQVIELERRIEAKRVLQENAAKERSNIRAAENTRSGDSNAEAPKSEDSTLQLLEAMLPSLDASVHEVESSSERFSRALKRVKESMAEKTEPKEPKLAEVHAEAEDSRKLLELAESETKGLLERKAELEKSLESLGKAAKEKSHRKEKKAGKADRKGKDQLPQAGNGEHKHATHQDAGEPFATSSDTTTAKPASHEDSKKAFFDDSGKPRLDDNAVLAPKDLIDIDQSRNYLESLTQACEQLAAEQFELEKQLAAVKESIRQDSKLQQAPGRAHSKSKAIASKAAGAMKKALSGYMKVQAATTKPSLKATSEGQLEGGDLQAGHDSTPAAETLEGAAESDDPGGSKTALVSKEAQEGALELLRIYSEMEDIQAQIADAENRIRRAKHGAAMPGSADTGSVAAVVDDVPEENKLLRKEVQKKQRELNYLRKFWLTEKGKSEKIGPRQALYVEPATRLLLQRRPEMPAKSENGSEAESSESSSTSSSSSKKSQGSKASRASNEDGAGQTQEDGAGPPENSGSFTKKDRSVSSGRGPGAAAKKVTVKFDEPAKFQDGEEMGQVPENRSYGKEASSSVGGKLALRPSQLSRINRYSHTDADPLQTTFTVAGKSVGNAGSRSASGSSSSSSVSSAFSSNPSEAASPPPDRPKRLWNTVRQGLSIGSDETQQGAKRRMSVAVRPKGVKPTMFAAEALKRMSARTSVSSNLLADAPAAEQSEESHLESSHEDADREAMPEEGESRKEDLDQKDNGAEQGEKPA